MGIVKAFQKVVPSTKYFRCHARQILPQKQFRHKIKTAWMCRFLHPHLHFFYDWKSNKDWLKSFPFPWLLRAVKIKAPSPCDTVGKATELTADSRHHEHNSRVRLQCYGHRLHLTISWCLNDRGMNGLAGQCKGSQNYFISPLQYSRASWHHCMFPEYFAAVAHNLVCTHTYTDTDTGLSIFVNFTSALLCLYYVCVCAHLLLF